LSLSFFAAAAAAAAAERAARTSGSLSFEEGLADARAGDGIDVRCWFLAPAAPPILVLAIASLGRAGTESIVARVWCVVGAAAATAAAKKAIDRRGKEERKKRERRQK